MTFLRAIHTYLFPPTRTGLPLNLTASALARLKHLQAQEGWSDYQNLLDSAISLYAEQLLSTDIDAEVHRLRGLILGLRKAGTLVTELIRQQDYEDGRKLKLDTAAGDAAADRTADLYGTRYGRTG
jgi:hypothetical protein